MAKLASALWRDIMDHLRHRHASLCRQWFEELQLIELESGLLQIQTSNRVQQNYLQRKCLDQFTEAAQTATGALVAVRFVSGDEARRSDSQQTRRPPLDGPESFSQQTIATKTELSTTATTGAAVALSSDRADLEFEPMLISPDYSFENFITGPNNQLACAAAIAVANQPGTSYNPLFIHGGVGLGKTHLLQAICQSIIQQDGDKRIYYISCDAFMNQFIECVKRGRMAEFRDCYRHVNVLVIDDIHFLANRERSQEEFFHTFNALYQSNRQIILSSDSPPSEIPQLEERLISRFGWGLVANVTQPSYETRVAIIQAKASLRGITIPEDVVRYLASKIDSNARELEGAIVTLQGHAALQSQSIDMKLARTVLGDSSNQQHRHQITLQNIIDAVTAYYNVKLSDLQSKRRHKSITQPRQVCMWLARKHTRYSLEEIGGYFGGRDHTTVMHSIRTVGDRVGTNTHFCGEVDEIENMILSRG